MSVFPSARRCSFRRLAFGLCLATLPLAGAEAADPPARVVSTNLCTDQLAMMLAGEGQLVSVSRLAADERASNLAAEAGALVLNGGSAEEVLSLRPDLVLTGTYTNRAATELLRRLGVRVEVFEPVDALADVSEAIRRVGDLLGRAEAAGALAARYEAELARLRGLSRGLPRKEAAFYFANAYTAGPGTLADEVLRGAGFSNLARERGIEGSGRLPLEVLVLERPFLVRTRAISGDAPALAYEALDHPALAAIAAEEGAAVLDERWLVCGTPFVTRAIAALIEQRSD